MKRAVMLRLKDKMPAAEVTDSIDRRAHCESLLLDQYFVKATLKHFSKKRHPYDFRETYQILKELFGYNSCYVNFGYWSHGAQTIEPGRVLAIELATLLQLKPGDRLIDAGSGLGQAAIDLCQKYDLARVVGININPRQVGFANAITRWRHLDSCVKHFHGDACEAIGQLSGKGFKHIIAIECINHFSDPKEFLTNAYAVAGPGGSIALSLNIVPTKLGLLQKSLLNIAFGFSPVSIDQWIDRFEKAEFIDVKVKDVTSKVLTPSLSFALSRLADRNRHNNLSLSVKIYLKLQLKFALRSVRQGKLKYYMLAAKVPPDSNFL